MRISDRCSYSLTVVTLWPRVVDGDWNIERNRGKVEIKVREGDYEIGRGREREVSIWEREKAERF